MQSNQIYRSIQKIISYIKVLLLVVIILIIGTLYYYTDPGLEIFKSEKDIQKVEIADDNTIKDGVHVRTGLKEGEGLMIVIQNCTACHSARMISQNRATREGWKSMIVWMQETQNLWDLGTNEEVIIDYLAKHYAPTKKGRRQQLTDINWYEHDPANDN